VVRIIETREFARKFDRPMCAASHLQVNGACYTPLAILTSSTWRQKPDREGGLLCNRCLAYARASDTVILAKFK
jgi:ribosomal protein L34E